MVYKRKICVVTSTRADYGHLSVLIDLINQDKELDLQLVVTGTHLSREYGLTYNKIVKDGFTISGKMDLKISSDSSVGICSQMGIAVTEMARNLEQLKSDILVVLGDRYEIQAVVAAAMVSGVPVAHISGGETTVGAIDEAIRHSITKMSHLHFTTTETYRKRVIQLGEAPGRVFNFGELAVDSILKVPKLSKDRLESDLGVKFKKHNLMITFHPETLGSISSEKTFGNLIAVLDRLEKTFLVFSRPNADKGNIAITDMLCDYVRSNSSKAVLYPSLGKLLYLNLLHNVDAVVGNSSSGITEAPSFKIGTINVGDRQKGRIRAESVIDCDGSSVISIERAFCKLYSEKFQKRLPEVTNPYGNGGAAERILKVLQEYDLTNILKKTFYDLEFVIN